MLIVAIFTDSSGVFLYHYYYVAMLLNQVVADLSPQLTKKSKGSQQGHKMQHNDGKDFFLGSLLVLPVELWKGIAG